MKGYGFTIEATLITTIDPDKEVNASMNKINATARLTEAIKNEADANYIIYAKRFVKQKRIVIEKDCKVKVFLNSVWLFWKGLNRESIKWQRNIQELDTMKQIGQSKNTKVLFFERKSEDIRHEMIAAQEAEK
jgi:hypothetical protein